MRLLGELRHFGWQDTLASNSWSHDKAPPHPTYGTISFLVNLSIWILKYLSGELELQQPSFAGVRDM